MTEQEHLEISRKLALAIGWKPEQMDVYDDKLWIERLHNLRRRFDYRAWEVIGPIAERFGLDVGFKDKIAWKHSCSIGHKGRTVQEAIAKAVIEVKGVK